MTEIRQVLREVDTAEHATRLSDTDLVLLAAAASAKTRRDAPARAVPEGPGRRARGEDLPGRLDRRGRRSPTSSYAASWPGSPTCTSRTARPPTPSPTCCTNSATTSPGARTPGCTCGSSTQLSASRTPVRPQPVPPAPSPPPRRPPTTRPPGSPRPASAAASSRSRRRSATPRRSATRSPHWTASPRST